VKWKNCVVKCASYAANVDTDLKAIAHHAVEKKANVARMIENVTSIVDRAALVTVTSGHLKRASSHLEKEGTKISPQNAKVRNPSEKPSLPKTRLKRQPNQQG